MVMILDHDLTKYDLTIWDWGAHETIERGAETRYCNWPQALK